MGKVYNALDLKKGITIPSTYYTSKIQPIQFNSYNEKNYEWVRWNMQYMERETMSQIKRKSPKLLRNLRLANGIIDKTDYIKCEENEYSNLFEVAEVDNLPEAYELQFFPIIPNIINLLRGEFSNRNSKIMFRATDDDSYNEMVEEKRSLLEQSLIQSEQNKLLNILVSQGLDVEDEEYAQYLAPENIQTLPQIESFFNKTYRSLIEEWATHQLNVDERRFYMKELEEIQFLNLLTFDKEAWHFEMYEDDYDVEPWDILTMGYSSSPKNRYLSNASWVTKIDILSVSDVIDKYGWVMDSDQVKSLERKLINSDGVHDMSGFTSEDKYDASKSWEDNMNLPSVAYRSYKDFSNRWLDDASNILSPDWNYFILPKGMVKVVTSYWKTHRLVGHLTKVTQDGELIQDIVSEEYIQSVEPIYDTTYQEDKNRYNLIYGEHIDWLWINEVWGARMINSDRNTKNPIIIGINQNKPGRLKFQFKGDSSLYGCKLPVEGWLGENHYIDDNSLVRPLTPFQLLYNMTLNQVTDIQINELGVILNLDHNTIPKQALGEDWGKGNIEKVYQLMKEFGINVKDSSLANTEGSLIPENFPVLDLSQTNRLLGRLELAKYYKQMAFETVGVTPQRLGSVTAQETATGTQAALNNSYAQTEKWFTIHSDYIMPRVHEMRTNLAQYYHSTKPSIRLQYMLSNDEKVNFQMNTTNLLSRDINVFVTTRSSDNNLLESLKQLSVQDNTSGFLFPDKVRVVKAESIAEIDRVIKETEKRLLQESENRFREQQELQKQKEEADRQYLIAQQEFDYNLAKLKSDTDIQTAYIRAAGFGNGQDVNQNKESDFIDNINKLNLEKDKFNEKMNLERQKEVNKMNIQKEHLQIQRDKVNAQREKSIRDLKISKNNK